jgi:preprotein translocase subunit SecG
VGMLTVFLLVVHVLVAVGVCGLVLLQHGKGADMGAAFGSGSSGSLFSASGSANFLSRSTGILAAIFFISSLGLTWMSGQRHQPKSVMDPRTLEQPVKPAAPAAGSAAPATAPPAAPTDSKAGDIPK